MTLQRLVLLAIMVACILDLERSRRFARVFPDPLRILVVAAGASHEVEGFVRYLYWEFTMRNRYLAEIALEITDQDGESEQIARRLLADGYLVEGVPTAPTLVFRMQAE